MILITGCARSGTKYIASVLQHLGLDVQHESLGQDGIASWIWAVEADGYVEYHDQGPQPEFDVILHQVREPLQTIVSITTLKTGSLEWASEFVPIDNGASKLQRAAEYYLHWNLMALARAQWSYRIEDLPDVWHEFTGRVGVQADYSQIEGVPRNIHTREHRVITWDDVEEATPLCKEIKGLARLLGYRVK